MKITSIRPYICDAYRTNWVFVHIQTDEGFEGWGEATLEYRERTVAMAIKELAEDWVGKDPFAIEALWHDAYRDTYFRGGPVYMSALSGMEMALWDIKGKALNVPVYELLGGKVRDRISCYANGWFAPAKTPEEFAAKAIEAVEMGFKGLKWDPFGDAYLSISKAKLHQALDCVSAVHSAVGDRAELLIEAHGRFDIPTAIRIARELEAFDILWFEEPLPPGNLSALREVKERVRVPIAAGERLYGRWDYREFFDILPSDYLQPDPSHVGGIGELKKIAATAETHFLSVCPHNPSGPVANAVSLQLAACIPNYFVLETMAIDVPQRSEICDEVIRMENGEMLIPDKPGLGISLDLEALAKYPFQKHPLRHYRGDLTAIRPENAKRIF